MEHQVQSLVLVDNEWVSRPHDVYQIMAGAQQEDTEMPDAIARPTVEVPEYGLLSRTIFSTPLTKFVLPANIRHRDHTDVVLIGEDSIQLKEIRDYGQLRHVATKTDFKGARILAAKVFGDPREVPTTRGAGSSLPRQHARHRARRSMTGDEECLLPPEVMVLTLSSRALMFLWARTTQIGAVTFTHKTVRLPASNTRTDRIGTFLAIDSKSRAMAVAAYDGRFILYKTKSMESWRAESRTNMDCTPIEDERIIQIDGAIMHMSFLSSGGGVDDYHVVLLFIVVHQNKTKITCFDWDCRQDLARATARTERVLLDFEDQSPSLLIPLSRSPDFLLVFDTHISVYKDVLSGLPKRFSVRINSQILLPLIPGDSKCMPKWVGWDRTPRNPEFSKEVFYIAREDGRIIYAERGPVNPLEITEAGVWPYRVDTAFACLTVDNSEFSQLYPDVLIAGGSGNDGLLCKVGSWPSEYSYASQYPVANQITCIESISNWTPLTDLSVTRLLDSRASIERERSGILVASGNSPHGEIAELRYGVQASIDHFFGGMTGCTGISVLDYGSLMTEYDGTTQKEHYATLAITLPLETIVVRVVRTQPESRGQCSGAWESRIWNAYQVPSDDIPIDDGVMRDEETISACHWSDRHSIQITRQEARTLLRPSLRQHAPSIVFDSPLLLAASAPGIPFAAITYREAGNTYLETVSVSTGVNFERAKETRIQLAHDPTCLEILELDGNPYIFVSIRGSEIMLFRVEDNRAPICMLSVTPKQLCESAVVLLSKGQPMLVCATRDGCVLNTLLTVNASAITCGSWHSATMGTTSAHVRRSHTDLSSAFVACGPDFCRVRCSSKETSGIEIDSIWFTDRGHPEYSQSAITAMYQLPSMREQDSEGRNLGGFLFAVAGDQLLFSQLDSDIRWTSNDDTPQPEVDSRAIPRKITTGAKPVSIAYLESQRRMIVSTLEAKEARVPPEGYRVLSSTLNLLKMNDDKSIHDLEIKQEDGTAPPEGLLLAQCQLENAERVHCTIEWPFVDHQGKKRSLLIVGTSIQVGPGKFKGRRLIFSTGKSHSKLQLQKDSHYDHPVYSIAMWSNNSIAMVVGKTLSLEFFDSQAGRWYKRGVKELSSPGMHVSVAPPFVYVSTQSHSHICYKVNGPNEERYEFEQYFTDSRERSCTQHAIVDLPSDSQNPAQQPQRIILVTDKTASSITALHQPHERTFKNAAATLFEATLPHTVIRLQRSNIRPPWRRPTHSNTPTGILTDDIIGACSDGTIYSFSILSQPVRHLLRLLQNLIEARQARDPVFRFTCATPHTSHITNVLINGAGGAQDGKIRAIDVDPVHRERGVAGPRHKCVDGDLIGRWREEGGRVEELVAAGEDVERDVGVMFLEYAGRVDGGWVVGSGMDGLEAVVERVERWVGEVLMSVL
ncbi:hypothetical protein T440DRAFT_224519 [Plenodomus tracheiphilus IPT5]|uniref:RSE1/DDB1/CPSF1 first beta-propeller domain-containing protein n=1 Tax=Plenodomus tracheiphilus IPT5 TaxID=1408161 RepID=A0A6A7ATI7_9PLEO|nr:hypothetical protein T440DRAFT_224519 [Plenodomus tracheiphilus IPT5]